MLAMHCNIQNFTEFNFFCDSWLHVYWALKNYILRLFDCRTLLISWIYYQEVFLHIQLLKMSMAPFLNKPYVNEVIWQSKTYVKILLVLCIESLQGLFSKDAILIFRNCMYLCIICKEEQNKPLTRLCMNTFQMTLVSRKVLPCKW